MPHRLRLRNRSLPTSPHVARIPLLRDADPAPGRGGTQPSQHAGRHAR